MDKRGENICICVIPLLCGNKDKLGVFGAHRTRACVIVINRLHFREEIENPADVVQLAGSGSEDPDSICHG